MIKSTKNNKELVKICRGGQTIWEILSCEVDTKPMKSGDSFVNGYFFPKEGTTISMEIEEFDMDTYTSKILYSNSSPTIVGNYFNFSFSFPLKQGYAVAIKVTNPSCKPINKTITIY